MVVWGGLESSVARVLSGEDWFAWPFYILRLGVGCGAVMMSRGALAYDFPKRTRTTPYFIHGS